MIHASDKKAIFFTPGIGRRSPSATQGNLRSGFSFFRGKGQGRQRGGEGERGGPDRRLYSRARLFKSRLTLTLG